jgi:putative hydroxymethylpyrimidine transport system substrate-binding protein
LIRSSTALLLALTALVLAACGERENPPVPGQPQTERLDLVLDYLPNADHAGIYAGLGTGAFEQVNLDVRLQTPRRPGGAAAAARRRPRRPGDLVPARAHARPREGREARLDRRARAGAADEPHLARQGRDPRSAPARGQDRRHRGIPYQDAYLKAILAKAGVDEASVKKVNVAST